MTATQTPELPKGAFAVIGAASVAIGLAVGLPQGTISEILRALDCREGAGGLLASGRSVGSVTGYLLTAVIIRRIGDTRAVLLGLIAAAVAWGVLPLTHSYAPALACFILAGAGSGLIIAGATACAGRAAGTSSLRRMALIHAGYVLGIAAGSLLGSYSESVARRLPGRWTEAVPAWSASYGIVALLLAGVMLAALPIPGRAQRASDAPPEASLLALLRAPCVALGAVLLFLFIGIEMSLGFWLRHSLVRRIPNGDVVGGWAVCLLFLGLALGRLILRARPPRMAPARFLAVTCLPGATAAALLLVSTPGVLLAAAALTGLLLGPAIPFSMSAARSRLPGDRVGPAVALMLSIGTTGGFVFPLLMGTVMQWSGHPAAALLLAPAAALAAVGLARRLI